MSHHKIWENSRHPYKRNDKGKKATARIRQLKKRTKQTVKRLKGMNPDNRIFIINYVPSTTIIPTCQR